MYPGQHGRTASIVEAENGWLLTISIQAGKKYTTKTFVYSTVAEAVKKLEKIIG